MNALSSTSVPLVRVQDDVIIKGDKEVKVVFILEPAQPDDLKDTIESLIEIGLSNAETMRDVLRITGGILRREGRFDDIAREMEIYGEIVFREDRCMPFNMMEARAIMSKMRKWLNAIERRLEAQQFKRHDCPRSKRN